MLKVYVIKSITSGATVAEIRVSNDVVDFIVDNTGFLKQQSQNSFSKLQAIVAGSSTLQMEEPQAPAAHLLRYVLNNGDVVEITTDGKTCLINGELIGESEKNALMSAIQRGELSISHKADIAKPVPVMPTMKAPEAEKPAPHGNQALYDRLGTKSILNRVKKDKQNSKDWDSQIENIDQPENVGYPAEMSKKLLYILKYGEE